MPKTGALSVVMDSGLILQLRGDARELRRSVSHIVKGLVADHYSLVGLPLPMIELLERDRLNDPRELGEPFSRLTQPPQGVSMNRRIHIARARAFAQIAVFIILFAVRRVAFAYAGQAFLDYIGTWIIGPACILFIVLAGIAAMVRPEFLTKAVFAAAICLVIFFIIREGDTVINLLRSGS
jgi:hypothetical protein